MRPKRIFGKILAAFLFFVRTRSKEQVYLYLEIAIFLFVVIINLGFILGGFKGLVSDGKETKNPQKAIGDSIGNPTNSSFEIEIAKQGRSQAVKSLSDVVSRARAHLKALKKPAFVVFGIPTVKRSHAYYLMDTLRSLMSRAPDDVKKRKEILIIILVADQRKDYLRQVTMDVNSEYETEVKNGLIQVIVPNESFYPNMFNLPQLYGDDQRRVYWRSKQSLDYSFLYYYCKNLGEYFVQLEDDVIAASQYYRKMKAFIKKNEYNNWSVLEFGSQGFIGMTYRTKHLKTLSKFIRFFYWTRPVDWLFRDYNQIYLNGNPSNFRIRPPVFLHAGKFSSLDGQVRKLGRGAKSAQSRTEREQLLHWPGQRRYQSKEGNPLAKITSTIDQHFGSNRLRNPYGPKGVFWAKGVHKKDNITIQFNKTQNISQIVFVSGPEGFKNDRFYTTRLFVSYTKPSIDGCSDFESVGVFGTPIVQYKIEDDVKRPVWCVRLMLEKVIQKRWIMVEEIAIHVDK